MAETALRQTGTRPVGAAPTTTRLFISVVVPVRNEEKFLHRVLEALATQDYPPERFEVLVADGRSTDATREVVRAAAAEYPNIRLVDNPKRWSSAGRNAAVRAARGDAILLIDGHCELDDPQYLAKLEDAFERSGADCIARPQPLDVTAATPVQRAIAAARSSRLGHNPESFIYSSAEGFVKAQTVGVAYRQTAFDRVGLFDESFDACEDVDFNHRLDRAGLTCYFTPSVALKYHPRATLRGLFRQMGRYGRGRVRLLRKHPETFSVGCFVPAAFVLGVVAGPFAALVVPWLALVYAGTLGLYATILALASVVLALRHRDRAMLGWLPLAFLTIHAGAGGGILWEGLSGLLRRPAAVEVRRPREEEFAERPRRRAA